MTFPRVKRHNTECGCKCNILLRRVSAISCAFQVGLSMVRNDGMLAASVV